jgi:hypothetical protein
MRRIVRRLIPDTRRKEFHTPQHVSQIIAGRTLGSVGNRNSYYYERIFAIIHIAGNGESSGQGLMLMATSFPGARGDLLKKTNVVFDDAVRGQLQ